MSGTILIVDDVATNRIVLKVKLTSARYTVLQAASAHEALEVTRTHLPDLILLDMQLPDLAGADLVRQLRAAPATALVPVIMISSSNDSRLRLEALRAGADDVMTKPLDELGLLARLRSLLRARETNEELRLRETTSRALGFDEDPAPFEPPYRIGFVSAQPEDAIGWRRALAKYLPDADLRLITRDNALAQSQDDASFDAFVMTADLARAGDGLRLMSELRSRNVTRHCAICIALPETMRETASVALDLGANDVLPFDLRTEEAAQEAALRISAQIRRKRTLDRQRDTIASGLRLATIDPLTGLYNRRYALPHLRRIAQRAEQNARVYALLLVDIDHFKSVNDTYGHSVGDHVLVEVAHRLSLNMREVDMVARIGGEEFLVVMPDTSLEIARSVAQRLCDVIHNRPVRIDCDHAQPVKLPVSVSIGVAIHQTGDESGLTFDNADSALLLAKAQGRNRVVVFDPDHP
ncbi:diguanylate cyclase [Albirhodobacter sp. R86504]|uniref:diguanylate cyclase n=1 Tax=Albirhodobacter sp. R86504 TaxID=3093848 RepID=UPI0036714055